MAGVTDSALAAVLLRGREDFNQRFLRARHHNRRLSAERFSKVLRGQAAPVAQAVAAIVPARLDATVSALYDNCLQLTGLDLLGPGSHMPAMDLAFERLLPVAAPLIAKSPDRVIGSVANAVYNLTMEPAADALRWIDTMTTVGQDCEDVDRFLRAGQVAAWACGMAHFRSSVLTAAAKLPLGLLLPIFGLDGEAAAVRLLEDLADPWYVPSRPHEQTRELRLVARTGGFIGFGGPFANPPEVARFGDRLYAFDHQHAWWIFADAFGVVLRRFGNSLPDGNPVPPTHFDLDRKGNVSYGALKSRIPHLAGWSSLASTEHTLAVTLPHSHHLFLVAVS